jgi:hypothetical protein
MEAQNGTLYFWHVKTVAMEANMTDVRNFDGQSKLPDAIAALLAIALPADRHGMIVKLTGIVASCGGVVQHSGKRWGDLTEAEGSVVAHKVGVIAREILGTGRAVQSRQSYC